MNPYLLDFLEGLAGLIFGTAIVAVPYSIWRKKHPKQNEAPPKKEQLNKELRPGSTAHYEAWRAEQLAKKNAKE